MSAYVSSSIIQCNVKWYLDKATSLVALYKRSKEPILLDEADRCQAKAEALLELLED